MLKHCFFYIKNEYYFASNPSNYTVKSNFLFRHGPSVFPGKGGVGWMGGMICIDSPSGNIKFNQSQIWFTGMQKLQHVQYHCQSKLLKKLQL
jgi:hypothetical protein